MSLSIDTLCHATHACALIVHTNVDIDLVRCVNYLYCIHTFSTLSTLSDGGLNYVAVLDVCLGVAKAMVHLHRQVWEGGGRPWCIYQRG